MKTQQKITSVPPPHESRLLLRTRPARTPYDARPDRPLLQIGVRAGLWAALGVGCVGGLLAIAGVGDEAPPVVEEPADEASNIPGPAAAVAETTVLRWLTVTGEDRDTLAPLFVEPPPSADEGPGAGSGAEQGSGAGLEVRGVTAVAGERLQDGYWSVTVAAEVVIEDDDGVEGPVDSNGDGIADDADDTEPTTWYVEVGIVGDGNGGFIALAAPAVVPPPVELSPTWGIAGDRRTVDPEDPLALTVQQFLGALLTGEGDPAPYLAPGADIPAAQPAPFTGIAVVEIATEELGEGRTWLLAHVVATTADGVQLPLSYDLTVVERVDRWEVEALEGIPTFIE